MVNMKAFYRFFLVFCLVLSGLSNAQAEDIKTNGAKLRAVDKITGRVVTFTVPVGDSVHFGSLSILLHSCVTKPPEETPENKAFLDISETKQNQAPETVFRGWMFSSSPSISAMEHPVFDIWVLQCVNLEEKEIKKTHETKQDNQEINEDEQETVEEPNNDNLKAFEF